MSMLIFLYLLTVVTSHYINITEDECWQHVNYNVPRENGTVLDPCNDGECWTYCDHEKWYDMNFEDYEYTAERLKHEQYDCVETGCADFYYGNFNLEILEECVSAKCKISHDIIEASRQCSTILIQASAIYKTLYDQKTNYMSITEYQRTMTEFSKTRFISEIDSIVENEKNTMEQLQLASDKINEFLNIKDTEAEQYMLESVQIVLNALNISVKEDVRTLSNHIYDMQTRLYSIHNKIEYGMSIEYALRETKDFINNRRDEIINYFIWQNETCAPLSLLTEHIEQSCSVCATHGKCIFQNNSFSCDCEAGWKGDMCQFQKNSCIDEPCLNDAKCVDQYNSFRCECTDEWQGTLCQDEIDVVAGCTNLPCINGGTCVDVYPMGYQCQCPFNYVGKNCQQAVDDCEPTPCVHGTCKISTEKVISCECDQEPIYNQPFWTGQQCNIAQDSCEFIPSTYLFGVLIHGRPCSGHGTCELDHAESSWKCNCNSDYIGKRCNIRLDDANPCVLYNIPCFRGNCVNCQNNTETCSCECDEGWEGEQCSIDTDDCDPNPCKNNAKCIDKLHDFYCDCSTIKKPWTGKYCELPADGCLHGPCGLPEQHQTCETDWTSHSGIECHCNPGWWGNRCQINADKCYDAICMNGGSCIQGLYAFCNCPEGWEGNRCERPIEYCGEMPCGTNGQCESTPTGFKCNCFEGWGGQRCNENINECKNITCLNGGSCIDHINRYKCTCTGDWYGTHCETLKSSCDDVHCENYGVCVDTRYELWTSNPWECACTKGYSGEKCTIDPGTTFSFTMMIGIGVGIIIISGPTCVIFWSRFKQKESTRNKRKHRVLTYQNYQEM